MTIIPYTLSHHEACMAVFHTNTPKYFHPNEAKTYSDFLLTNPSNYFVGLKDNKIIACGGVYFKENVAGFTWGMVRNDLHKTGVGTQLLEYRLDKIKEQLPSGRVLLETSQHTYSFFQKFGFVIDDIKPEGIIEGLDLYKMHLDLTHELA